MPHRPITKAVRGQRPRKHAVGVVADDDAHSSRSNNNADEANTDAMQRSEAESEIDKTVPDARGPMMTDAPTTHSLLNEAKAVGRRRRVSEMVPIFSGTVAQVCEHRPHVRYMRARRNQMKYGMTTAEAKRLARRAGHVRLLGRTYGDETEMVDEMGHTNTVMVGTHGGGDGPWLGIPSTPKQKRSPAYALHTRVQPSGIEGAGLGLYMLEKAKAEERVAIYSGELLTKEQADRSSSKYIVKVGKFRCSAQIFTIILIGRLLVQQVQSKPEQGKVRE